MTTVKISDAPPGTSVRVLSHHVSGPYAGNLYRITSVPSSGAVKVVSEFGNLTSIHRDQLVVIQPAMVK